MGINFLDRSQIKYIVCIQLLLTAKTMTLDELKQFFKENKDKESKISLDALIEFLSSAENREEGKKAFLFYACYNHPDKRPDAQKAEAEENFKIAKSASLRHENGAFKGYSKDDPFAKYRTSEDKNYLKAMIFRFAREDYESFREEQKRYMFIIPSVISLALILSAGFSLLVLSYNLLQAKLFMKIRNNVFSQSIVNFIRNNFVSLALFATLTSTISTLFLVTKAIELCIQQGVKSVESKKHDIIEEWIDLDNLDKATRPSYKEIFSVMFLPDKKPIAIGLVQFLTTTVIFTGAVFAAPFVVTQLIAKHTGNKIASSINQFLRDHPIALIFGAAAVIGVIQLLHSAFQLKKNLNKLDNTIKSVDELYDEGFRPRAQKPSPDSPNFTDEPAHSSAQEQGI